MIYSQINTSKMGDLKDLINGSYLNKMVKIKKLIHAFKPVEAIINSTFLTKDKNLHGSMKTFSKWFWYFCSTNNVKQFEEMRKMMKRGGKMSGVPYG